VTVSLSRRTLLHAAELEWFSCKDFLLVLSGSLINQARVKVCSAVLTEWRLNKSLHYLFLHSKNLLLIQLIYNFGTEARVVVLRNYISLAKRISRDYSASPGSRVNKMCGELRFNVNVSVKGLENKKCHSCNSSHRIPHFLCTCSIRPQLKKFVLDENDEYLDQLSNCQQLTME